MPPNPESIERFIRHALERGHSEERIRAFLDHKGYEHPLGAPADGNEASGGPSLFSGPNLIMLIVVGVLVFGGVAALLTTSLIGNGSTNLDDATSTNDQDVDPIEPETEAPFDWSNVTIDAPPEPMNESGIENASEGNESENITEAVNWGSGSSGGGASSGDDDDEQIEEPEDPPALNISTMTYAANESDIDNPERGFYWSTTFGDSGFSWVHDRNVTLVRTIIRLDDYLTSDIPQPFLDDANTSFGYIRDAGLKAVVRVAYNFNSSGWDPNLTQTLTHIEQLEGVFANNSDVIAVFEAGYIGAWGEWHSSSSGLASDTNKDIIMSKILNHTPMERTIQFRYPPDIMRNYPTPLSSEQAFTTAHQARVGHHNDCFLSGPYDVGTYWHGEYTMEEMQDYLGAIGPYTWMGGETCNKPIEERRSDCATTLYEMERFGWTHINEGFYADVIQQWKNEGCYDEIRRRLGYRFVLEAANLTNTTGQSENLTLDIRMRNDGWAPLHNERPMILVLEDGSGRTINATIAEDARDILPLPNGTVKITFTTTIPPDAYPGEYEANIWLPDDDERLRDDVRYHIRFANNDTWDVTSGMNALNLSIEVTGTPPPLDPGSGLLASYFNTTSSTRALVRTDSEVNFSWGTGSPENVSEDHFSAIWNGSIAAPQNRTYVLSVRSDDGFRLYVNGTLAADSWDNYTGEPGSEPIVETAPITLTPWERVPIMLEYFEANGSAMIELGWRNATDDASSRTIVPARYLYPASDPAPAPPSGAAKDPESEDTGIIIGPQAVASGNVSNGTIFASPSGSGTDCTEGSPCSLTTATGQADPGDHVFLRGGTYPITSQISLSDTATNETPIIIESYPGERAVIDGQHTASRIAIWGSFYTLRNVNVTRMNATGVYIGGVNNTIEGVSSYNNHLSGFQIFSPYENYPYGSDGSYNTIRDCRAFNNSDVGLTWPGYDNGGNADGISISSGTQNVVLRCAAYNNSDDGIDVWRSTHSLVAFSIAAGSGAGDGNGVGFKMGGTSPSNGSVVMHSIAYDNTGVGFSDNSGQNVKILSVTSYNNPYRGFYAESDDRIELSIAAGTGNDDTQFGSATEVNNSWQIIGTLTFLSTDPDSPDYLKPTPGGDYDHIGAYAESPYMDVTDARLI